MKPGRGFTLIELIVTIVLSAIVVSFMAMFIAGPIRGYNDQTRRARLVDLADDALRNISRDIRRALPNSIRVTTNGSVVAIEMLNTVDGVRYREQPPPDDDSKRLDFAAADTAFNTIGAFTGIAKPFSSAAYYLAVYNVGVPGANAYELANVITPPGTTITIDADSLAGEDAVTLSPGFQFAYGSPDRRMYLVDGPIAYLCDTTAGTLVRYTGYTIAADQSTRDSAAELGAAGASAERVANRISGCGAAYSPGTAQRAGLVSLRLGVSEAGETISLLHQVHVSNAP
jgi:MSHA biogenesis protein MshO